MHRRTIELIPAGKFEVAAPLCREGFTAALAAGEYELAARFQMNLGGIQFATRQFQSALDTYQKAHTLAQSHGAHNVAALLTANLASLYSQLGELDSAATWLEASLATLSGADRVRHLPKLQLQLAAIRAQQGRMDAALPLYRDAINLADAAGDWALYATAWNRLGGDYLRLHDLERAEPALLESWRVRKLRRLPVGSSLFNLGCLKLARGENEAASVLLDRAVALSHQPNGMLPTWDLYLTRGKLLLDQGRHAEALADLRIALGLARAWRWAAPADEASRVGGEEMLQKVYAALIDAGNLAYERTRDVRLRNEAADMAEENRAASLRDLISDPTHFRSSLPAEYWQAVGRLQRAEVAALRNPSAAAEAALEAVRAELVRVEAGLGPGREAPEKQALARTRAALGEDTAAFAFQLGDARSWLWAIDRAGAEVYELPAAGSISDAVAAVSRAVQSGGEDWRAPATRLHQMLFGKLDERFRRRPTWLVAPDTRLFDAPLSALVDARSGRALAEEHAIQVIPNLSAVIRAADARVTPDGPFVAVGDAIYNAADPRHRGAEETLDLPRLVGSSAEIRSCARLWGGDEILLTGRDASRARLLDALARNPAVVHIAAHVVQSTRKPAYGLIAFSPGGAGGPDLLAPYDIARWRFRAGVVVLSGCSSGAGPALPGAGLLGLTRAWLAAGARNVVASRWPVTDDRSGIFEAFYRHLQADGVANPAQALQKAQKDIMLTGGYLSHPRHWGAYFVVGAPPRRGGV
jgi:CHAT domain-containing protein